MVDLTKYSPSAVVQLLNGNADIKFIMHGGTDGELLEHIHTRYKITKEQEDYFKSVNGIE